MHSKFVVAESTAETYAECLSQRRFFPLATCQVQKKGKKEEQDKAITLLAHAGDSSYACQKSRYHNITSSLTSSYTASTY